ncbi:MAG: 16S rRNA (cytosine(1402)-N(4))-methyltransferase RsmH [Candidatus Lambdaproteobacteria bacterium]|nr:16S rRNA (cytosine(1402)-N(4))-methyltransferase RsmH [Candidatus Lambdaproteobacteria bacterium]
MHTPPAASQRRSPEPPRDQLPAGGHPIAGEPRPAFVHAPVLLEEVLAFVPADARMAVDATLGGGGHAEALLRRFPAVELFGCDRDPEAVEAARARLEPFAGRVLVRRLRFSELPHHVLAESVDFLLADLGVSSPQLDRPERGFSFSQEGALDMRMDASRPGQSAADLVNRASGERLRALFERLGEEPFAARMAEAIVEARRRAPIASTTQLAALLAAVVPARARRRGFHPATRAFQALRMAVNDEPAELERLLDGAPGLLRAGGRLAVISFHSLEDRPVKLRFRTWEAPCECPPELPRCICGKQPLGRRVTRRPVTAGAEEAARNPRSRSAKLRVFEKR